MRIHGIPDRINLMKQGEKEATRQQHAAQKVQNRAGQIEGTRQKPQRIVTQRLLSRLQ